MESEQIRNCEHCRCPECRPNRDTGQSSSDNRHGCPCGRDFSIDAAPSEAGPASRGN